MKMKKSEKILIGCGAAAVALPLFLLAPGRATKGQKAPFWGRNFAHRGLHSRDKSVPENSLKAFALASEAGYGMELDVQLTRDGQVVVFHDDTLDRVCGIHGRVDDYTFAELQKFPLCGTAERIPLFSDVLNTVSGRGAIICELKTAGKKNRELSRKTYDLIAAYPGEICVESFDPRIVAWFRFHAPELLRGQLAQTDYPEQSPFQGFVLRNCLLNFLARPQFIAYQLVKRPLTVRLAEALGAMRVAWTSHEPKNEKGQDAVIFEFYRPRITFK